MIRLSQLSTTEIKSSNKIVQPAASSSEKVNDDAKMSMESPKSVSISDEVVSSQSSPGSRSPVELSFETPKKETPKEFGSLRTPAGRRSARIATRKGQF